MGNKKYTGWRNVWHIYPWRYLLKSIWRPLFLELLCIVVINMSSVPTVDMLGHLCSFVNGGYPSIVGFVLSGYALLIGFSNSELIQKLSKRKNENKPALFQKINATFAMMLLMLVVTLLFSFVVSIVMEANVSGFLFLNGYENIINTATLYIFLFIIFYSLFSLLDVVMNIFNFGQFAFVINDLKNKEVQQNKDSVEGQSDYPCLIWILVKLYNFFKRL